MCIRDRCKVDDAFTSIINAGSIACKVVELGGTQEQKEMFYDKVANGAFVGMCITEANAGSDVSAIATTAVRDGEEYVLNGMKLFVSNGSIADYFIVFASTDKRKGSKGISAFIVEGDRPGISRGKREKKLGVHCGDTCVVTFDNVRIPAGNLLGNENEGFKLTMQTLDRGRVKVAAMAIGHAPVSYTHLDVYKRQTLCNRLLFCRAVCRKDPL